MNEELKVRLDKWLWAARFFKTRSMATQAVNGGKVHVNKQRVKPARLVQLNDELRIQRGEVEFTVVVLGLNDKRRPAKEAQLLYAETEESLQKRETIREEKHYQRLSQLIGPLKRPGKKDRRKIKEFIRKGEY